MSSSESIRTELELLESDLIDLQSKDENSETNILLSHRVFGVAFTGIGNDYVKTRVQPNKLISERLFLDGLDKLDAFIAEMWRRPSEGLIRWTMIESGANLSEILTASKSISRHGHFTPALQAALRRHELNLRHRLKYVRLFALRMEWAELSGRFNSVKDDRVSSQPSRSLEGAKASHGLAAAHSRGRTSAMRRAVLLGLFLLVFLTALAQVFGESGG